MSLKSKSIAIYLDNLNQDENKELVEKFFNNLDKDNKLKLLKKLSQQISGEANLLDDIYFKNLDLSCQVKKIEPVLIKHNFVRIGNRYWQKKNSGQYVYLSFLESGLYELEIYFGDNIKEYIFYNIDDMFRFLKLSCFSKFLIEDDIDAEYSK